METKITKKIIALLSAIILCVNVFAQAEKTPQQKQDEAGAALKKWFDESEIIIDCTPEEAKYVENTYPNSGDGYLCQKIKINHVLKGKLNTGHINLKLSKWSNDGYPGYRYLLEIKKTDLTNGAYEVENIGVYIATGATKSSSISTYEMLKKYGVKINDIDKLIEEQKIISNRKQAIQDSIDLADLIKNSKVNEKDKKEQEEKEAKFKLYLKRRQEIKDSIKSSNDLKKKINNSSINNATGCAELYISEYLCGQGNNKAIEIYNPTYNPINLSNYSVLIYHGASYTPTCCYKFAHYTYSPLFDKLQS